MKSESILVLAMVALLAASASAGTYSGGDGSAEYPYKITTPNDLNEIGANLGDWGSHFVMVNDVNLADYTGTQFNIIGYYEYYDSPNNVPFTGIFDGNGHTISNFSYQSNDAAYVGLFSYVGYADDPNAVIRDLHLTDPNVDAGTGDYVGSAQIADNDGNYLELTLDVAMLCGKVRFYVDTEVGGSRQCKVDIYYDGGWHNIYSRVVFSEGEWIEASFSAQSTEKARIKVATAAAGWQRVHEFVFWQKQFFVG